MARKKEFEFRDDVPDEDFLWHNSKDDDAEVFAEVLTKERFNPNKEYYDDR